MDETYQTRLIFTAWFSVGIALILLAIGVNTDVWYYQDASGLNNTAIRDAHDLYYGLWRTCYYKIPDSIPKKERQGVDQNCVSGAHAHNVSQPDNDKIENLERAQIGCLVISTGILVFIQLILFMGMWPASPCQPVKRSRVCLCAAALSFTAGTLSIIGLIIFIVIRGFDSGYHRYLDQQGVRHGYGWSFIISWMAALLAIVVKFVFSVLAKVIVEDNTYMIQEKHEEVALKEELSSERIQDV